MKITVYAEVRCDVEMRLRSTLSKFPAAEVTRVLENLGAQVRSTPTVLPDVRIYAFTMYDPPQDVIYAIEYRLVQVGARIDGINITPRPVNAADLAAAKLPCKRSTLQTRVARRGSHNQKALRSLGYARAISQH